MRIQLKVGDLLTIPWFVFKLIFLFACAEDDDTICLLTQGAGKEIEHPVTGTDGRVYDGLALHRWLSTGVGHVIPGCPIHDEITIRLWSIRSTFKRWVATRWWLQKRRKTAP